MPHNEILIIDNLAAFEKLINQDHRPYNINLMCLPGTLEDKHISRFLYIRIIMEFSRRLLIICNFLFNRK